MAQPEHVTQQVIDEFVIAAHHDLPKVQEMRSRHPNLLEQRASWDESALGAASHVANRPIAEYLLAEGAPLDICAAAMLGRQEDVVALLESDAALVHASGAHDLPLLFHAAIGGSLETVRLLADRGADINAGAGKNTALHGAALFGHRAIAEYLLRRGADANALDHQGRTPRDAALAAGHEALAALLETPSEPR